MKFEDICGLFFISTSSFIWFLIWFLSYNLITPVITKLSFYLQLAACRRRVQSSSQWLNILSLEVLAGKWQVFISLLYTRQRQREKEEKRYYSILKRKSVNSQQILHKMGSHVWRQLLLPCNVYLKGNTLIDIICTGDLTVC